MQPSLGPNKNVTKVVGTLIIVNKAMHNNFTFSNRSDKIFFNTTIHWIPSFTEPQKSLPIYMRMISCYADRLSHALTEANAETSCKHPVNVQKLHTLESMFKPVIFRHVWMEQYVTHMLNHKLTSLKKYFGGHNIQINKHPFSMWRKNK